MSDPAMDLVATTCIHQRGKLTAQSQVLQAAMLTLGPTMYEQVWKLAFLAGTTCGTEIAKKMFKGEL